MGKFANVFALRYRGFDPERFSMPDPALVRLDVHGAGADFLCARVLLSASLLLASQYETVYARLPTFQQFFAADRWLILAATMAIVKVLARVRPRFELQEVRR